MNYVLRTEKQKYKIYIHKIETMSWTTFKENIPEFDRPIFVYKPTEGLFSFFKKYDDIRRCKLTSKIEKNDGLYYSLEGYDYGICGTVRLKKCDF